MADTTRIEWCDSTFNPWIGCTEISVGERGACEHCYARTATPVRAMGIRWGSGKPRHRTSESTWRQPLTWERQHEAFFAQHGRRRRVFCASLADVFDNEVPQLWRTQLFTLIHDTPHLDWLLLTKRIGNAASMMQQDPPEGIRVLGLPNVWLGATIANQVEADRDIPKLLATPARVRFLSCEPLLGPIDLRNHRVCNSCESTPHGLFSNDPLCPKPIPIHDAFQCPLHWWPSDGCDGVLKHKIDWVIAGGESGGKARPSHPDWFRSLRDQCAAAGVAFHFKQWGEWAPGECANKPATRAEQVATWWDGRWNFGKQWPSVEYHRDDEPDLFRLGKKAAGRTLDGVIHDAFPEVK